MSAARQLLHRRVFLVLLRMCAPGQALVPPHTVSCSEPDAVLASHIPHIHLLVSDRLLCIYASAWAGFKQILKRKPVIR